MPESVVPLLVADESVLEADPETEPEVDIEPDALMLVSVVSVVDVAELEVASLVLAGSVADVAVPLDVSDVVVLLL